ncbi:fumarylacetoacetate hydrolase family protein [Halalkalibacter wakoensis JCM 9140]|uniref:Fumarylacetoacetate hydrolase family protein n=1 Tax=Halalkalibacter wakoensis JCM 9140 TaxID=1236970 RepID=W4Q7Z7_9BACI|nr:fumarylacetoacetate hydrolase family protein [Halalkalibacter wakoensis]GAE28090.1 fumarylacetoacetate hydrolase family protein [Halalkalibacter wakoensis JCM 9140]
MKLVTIERDGQELAAIKAVHGLVLLEEINQTYNQNWALYLFDLITTGQLDELNQWYRTDGAKQLENLNAIPFDQAKLRPLYRHPHKILGIGMNYVAHPLAEKTKADPVSFIKPDTTLVGPGEKIHLPAESKKTTAEGELAIIIGKRCSNITEAEAPHVIAGYTTALDMTEADIHGQNPRYLTRAKSFDTFFSFGGELITADEIANVEELQVSTVLNGEVEHKNLVSNMIYNPWYLLSFHSKVMTFLPGDIILTGTPGPVVIRSGDVIECRIEGFTTLQNGVK